MATHVSARFSWVDTHGPIKDVFVVVMRYLGADARRELGLVSKETLDWTRAAITTLRVKTECLPHDPRKLSLPPYTNATTLCFVISRKRRNESLPKWDSAAFPAAQKMEIEAKNFIHRQINELTRYPLNITRFEGTWAAFALLHEVIPEERWETLETIELLRDDDFSVAETVPSDVRQRAVARLTTTPLKSITIHYLSRFEPPGAITIKEIMECPPVHLSVGACDIPREVVHHANYPRLEYCTPTSGDVLYPVDALLTDGDKRIAMSYTHKIRLDPRCLEGVHRNISKLDSTAEPNVIIMAFVSLMRYSDYTESSRSFVEMASTICLEHPDVLAEILSYIPFREASTVICILRTVALTCHTIQHGGSPITDDAPCWKPVKRIARRVFGAMRVTPSETLTRLLSGDLHCKPEDCPRLWAICYMRVQVGVSGDYSPPRPDSPAETQEDPETAEQDIIRALCLEVAGLTFGSWIIHYDHSHPAWQSPIAAAPWAEAILRDRMCVSSFTYIYNSVYKTTSPEVARHALSIRRRFLARFRGMITSISNASDAPWHAKWFAGACIEKFNALEKECTGVLREVLLGSGKIVLR
jgi:hypothetical protein